MLNFKGMKITCPHCSKAYHDSQSLKKHIDAVHLKIKRLCPLCGASVTALAVHMNSVHTGVKNFPCPECGKKFKQKTGWQRHLKNEACFPKPRKRPDYNKYAIANSQATNSETNKTAVVAQV